MLAIASLFVAIATGAEAPNSVSKEYGQHEDHADQEQQGMVLDLREPLVMTAQMAAKQKANMRLHLESIQAIVLALAVEDYAGIAAAGRRLGSGDGAEARCRHMAGGNLDFLRYAMGMHTTADVLVAAANAKDRAKVLDALGKTLSGCTACHARYKQEVQPLSH